MRNVTVAKRYARALYEVALQAKSVDDMLLAMSNVAHAYHSSMDLQRLMLNPLIKIEIKEKLAKSITSNKLVLKFLNLLAKRKRLDLLPTIYEQVTSLGDAAHGVHRALVKTALPLTDTQKRHVEEDLAKRVGGTMIGQFEVAKDLIGGVWVKMGDKVLDATIKGRIENFRHALMHSAN